MADKEIIHSTGYIPVDLSGSDAWDEGGGFSYETGSCTFKVLGYSVAKGEKKQIFIEHEILDGPPPNNANKGKRYRRLYTMSSPDSLKFMKGYFLRVGGENGLVAGKPSMAAIVGVIFKGNLGNKPYTKQKADGSAQEKDSYFIDMNTVEIISRPTVSAGNGANATAADLAPVQ